MPTITKSQIIWDEKDFLAGLHPQSGVGKPILFNGFTALTNFDPIRFLGYASPGYDFVDATDAASVTALVRNGVQASDSDGNGHLIGGALLHKLTTSTTTIIKTGGWPHTITRGTTPVGSDIAEYHEGTTRYIYFSYNNTTYGEVGRFPVGTSDIAADVDEDYLSSLTSQTSGTLVIGQRYLIESFVAGDSFTNVGAASNATGVVFVATGTTPTTWTNSSELRKVLDKDSEHPMIIGDDDVLYIGDGNKLHALESTGPTTSTYSQKVLVLKDLMEIKSFARIEPVSLVVFAEYSPAGSNKRGVVQANFWDYLALDPYKIKEVEGTDCGGAFEYKGSVGVFTNGRTIDRGSSTKRTHLNIFDGVRFKRIKSIIGDSEPIHGGVEVLGDVIYANIASVLYSFGSPFEEINIGVQKLATGDGSSSGMLKTFFTNKQLMSSGTGTSGGLGEFSSTTYSTGTQQSSMAEPFHGTLKKGKITRVRVEFKGVASGGRRIDIAFLNRTGTLLNEIEQITTVTADELIKEYTDDLNGNPFKTFDALQLQLGWATGSGNTDAPVVRRIIVDYEPININNP